MARARAYVRSLDPRLPRAVWLLQLGGFANAFGNGLAVPFLIIYLHNVRGLPLALAGLAAALAALAGLATGPAAGALVDRIGGRTTLAGALLLLASGYAALPFVHETWQAFACTAVFGAGSGAFWPSQSALTAGLTPRDRTHAAFSMQRVMNNGGMGLGAVAGGFVADVSDPSTFSILFWLDAATFLVFIGMLLLVPPVRVERGALPGRYADALRHRVFVAMLVLNALFVGVGYGLFELVGVYAKNDAGVPEDGIGFIFLANTALIVLAQLPVTAALEGRRRMASFALMGGIWAVAWVGVLAGGSLLAGAAATVAIAAAVAVFGVGECIHGTVQGALVADLAPPHLIGRYMALSSMSWQVGLTAGPAAGGAVLGLSPALLWLGAAAVCGGVAALALALEQALPRHARRTPRRLPAAAAAAREPSQAA